MPSGARLLLVNPDDPGMHASIAALIDSLDRGIVRSTSLVTTCPGTDEAIETLRRPDIPFGVHLTIALRTRTAPAGTVSWSQLTAKLGQPD